MRKGVSFAFGVALIVALGYAVSHAHALKVSDSIGFSAPCAPASQSFKAAAEAKHVSTTDSTFAAKRAGASAVVARTSGLATAAWAILLPAPQAFPPLLHRPPPANF